jgi:hypothetical protein
MTTPKSKPGTRTTEFWLTVLVIIAATLLRLTDDISENAWAVAVGIQGAGYALSRGIVKA